MISARPITRRDSPRHGSLALLGWPASLRWRCRGPSSPTVRTRSSAAGCSPRTRPSGSVGARAPCRPRSSRRRSRPPPSDANEEQEFAGADVHLRHGRSEPDRLRAWRHMRRERSRLLHADRPDGFTMWLREQGHVFDWGTMKWCQAYTQPAERLLRRGDDRARRVRSRRGPQPPRQLRRRSRLPRCRRADVLEGQAADRLQRTRLRPMRRRDPAAPVRRSVDRRQVLDLP